MLLVCSSTAAAAPIAQIVDQSQLVSTKINYKDGTRVKSKVIYCLGKVPGDVKDASGGVLFTPISVTIAKMKAKKIHGPKLNAQIAINKSGGTACARLQRGTTPTPTPTATPPVIGSGNFDIYGNVTAKGKTLFGIPIVNSGNITSGKTLVGSYCSGCHEERIGRSFPTLRTSIAQSPMLFDSTQITDAMLANIAAYLNRYNP